MLLAGRIVRVNSLFPKLLLAFMLVTAPLYVLGLVINNLGESSVREELTTSLQSKVDYYLSSLETEKTHIQKLQQDFVIDRDLLRLTLLSEAMPRYEWSDTVTRIHNKLQLVTGSSVYIDSVSIHVLTLGRTLSDDEMIHEGIESDYEAVKPVGPDETKGLRVWNGRLFLGMSYPETFNGRIQPSYVVSVELDRERLREALLRFADYPDSGALLTDPRRGWTVSSAGAADFADGTGGAGNANGAGAANGAESATGAAPEAGGAVTDGITAELLPFLRTKLAGGQLRGLEPLRVGGQTYLVSYQYSETLGAFLSSYIPQDRVFGEIATYRRLYWILSAVSGVVVVVYSYWIFRMIHRPLRTLVRSFRKIEEGKLELAELPRSGDEFLYLFQRFNMMIERLRLLIGQVYEEKIRAQSAELKQLQSQINPHFLYNTLFTLFRLAKLKDFDNVVLFSRHLSEYFLYMTRTAAGEVPLDGEVRHLRTYTEIQNLRFQDRIAIDFGELPEQGKRVVVPRLILQPIVENAYKYGLESKRRDGLIRIGFTLSDDGLSIDIEDNGEHLEDDRLAELSKELASERLDQEHTGLLNVHRRLRLMFGERSGLTVRRGGSGGMCVTLRLPVAAGDNGEGRAGIRRAADGTAAEAGDEARSAPPDGMARRIGGGG